MLKRIYRTLCVFSLSLFLFMASVSIAPAQEAGPLYLGIFGGYVIPQDLEFGPFDINLKDSWAAGAKVGYIIPQFKYVALEVEYTHMGKQDLDQVGFDGDVTMDNLMANALFRYPTTWKIHPFVGAGFGVSRGDVSAARFSSDTENAFAWQLMAGVNFEMTKNLSLDLAYKYFQAKWDISFRDYDVTSKNHLILLGLNFHF